jgi:hypothetical protein
MYKLIGDCCVLLKLLRLRPYLYLTTFVLVVAIFFTPSSIIPKEGLWGLFGVWVGVTYQQFATDKLETDRQKDIILRLLESLLQAHALFIRYYREHDSISIDNRVELEENLQKMNQQGCVDSDSYKKIVELALRLGFINFPIPINGNLTEENTFFIWKEQSPLYERLWARNNQLLSMQGNINFNNGEYAIIKENSLNFFERQDEQLLISSFIRSANFIQGQLNFIKIIETEMSKNILLYHFLLEYFYQKFPEEKLNLIYNIKTPYRKMLGQISLINRLLKEDLNTSERVNLICQYGLGKLSTNNTVLGLMIEGIPYA